MDEVLTIVHLKRGFEYLLKATDEPLLEKAKKINAIVASEDALFPGQIRNGESRSTRYKENISQN